MGNKKFDFSGWATKNDIKCSDGRTILRDAFKQNDGAKVPLVWAHQHDDPDNVLGYAVLENRPQGVYAYCSFNASERAQKAKELVRHGDIRSLSIFANQLKHDSNKGVIHGDIKEVSLVLAGANKGALIDFPVLQHSDDSFETYYDEANVFYETDGGEFVLNHTDMEEDEDSKGEKEEMADKTVGDVLKELTEEQKQVLYYLIGEALASNGGATAEHSDYDGGNNMKYNVFEDEVMDEEVLSHDAMMTIITDGKRYGSLKESFLQHAEEYGIENIEYLFPDARAMENAPQFIKRPDEWVDKIMKGTHHTPFSRIKSLYANITEDEARAKGYIKGNMKKEEVFGLLKRTTSPTTVYKKQKLDRDDIVDITDFDVVSWLKTEMRMMLDEELARAFLVGDQRDASSDDKISELAIRPIWTDADLFTIKKTITVSSQATEDQIAHAVIRAAVKSRKDYRGSGKPTLFTTEDYLTDMLLMEDNDGRTIYETQDKLATAMRVSDIVTVPVMENLTRTNSDGDTVELVGIIVNPSDYTVGSDKGGSVNMFEDFDIDYNQEKYLIETRCSGSLMKPYSAIVLELKKTPNA